MRLRSLSLLVASLSLACSSRPTATVRAPLRAAARARRALGPGDLVSGPNASGHIGDFVLENRHIRAVIERLPGGVSFALSGGCLLDLATQPDGLDELGQVFTLLGDFPRQIVFDRVALREDSDGTARVVLHGHDPFTEGLTGSTTYSLGPDDRALTLTTALHHHGSAPTTVFLADAIQWGSTEHFAPGAGFTIPRGHRFAWIAGVGRSASYAYSADAELTGPHGANWSNPSQRTVTLAPGDAVTYSRRFAVAPRGDPARALRFTRWSPQLPVLTVRAAASGAPVADVRVTVLDGARHPVAMGATDARGISRIQLPTGHFAIIVNAPGRSLSGPAPEVDVGAQGAGVDLALSPVSSLGVSVSVEGHATAVRVLLAGIDGTPDPVLGAIGRADGARNGFVTDGTGTAEVPLAPGRYRVTATHGPEFTLDVREVAVSEGARAAVTLALVRAVDSAGYVCGDFHQHQAPSLDAPLSLRDRVRADVAEGLEVVASTDHNMATDLTEAVRAEGFERALLPLAGDEVSTDIALRPIGHFNLFPLTVRLDEPRGGVPHFLELDAPSFFREVRAFAPDAVIQVNHPRSPAPTGMFNIVDFDPATGLARRAAFSSAFDAIEVWNGRWQRSVDEVTTDWFALLRAGARITATGNSDSHAVVTQEAGYPRTCLAVPDDRAGRFTAADVVSALKSTRDVFVTDGPFLRVQDPSGRSAIGRALPLSDGALSLDVSVQAPLWAAPDALEYLLPDGSRHPVEVTWQRGERAVTARVSVRVSMARGQFVVFRARGPESIRVLVGDPPLRPMAFTNPVWAE